jgi:hypothetical protein
MFARPHLRPARPVLINEKNQVVDGQHRLEGAKINGQSVFYMQVKGLTVDDARVLNALQRTWRLLDYAYSYASSRIPAYTQFVNTYEAHILPPSIVMDYMMPSIRRQHNFKLGLLQAVDQRSLDDRLGQAEDILEAFGKKAAPYAVSAAVLNLQKIEGYDHERMMKKLASNKVTVQLRPADYMRELERVYNADIGVTGPSYLRFF